MTAGIDSAEWDRRVAAVWADLFAEHGPGPAATLVEVGPGFAAKIGVALRTLGFHGTLYLVEPDDDARAWASASYRALLPRAEIVEVGAPLGSAGDMLPPDADALVMNHVLDDLVLRLALEPARRARAFSGMRPGLPCADDVRRTWLRLRDDPAAFHTCSSRALAEMVALVRRLRPGLVIVSQYRSWFHRAHGLEFVDRLTAPLLTRLAEALDGTRTSWRDDGDAARRWLIAESDDTDDAGTAVDQRSVRDGR